jgi:putative methionine-R-sulfoxide reductase with GAF domain
VERKSVKLDEHLEVSYYEFSDSVVCVEVVSNGEELGAFCSDISQFNEWDEEELKRLVESHVKQFQKSTPEKIMPKRKRLKNGIEIEYYEHSDDMLCVNLFKNNQPVGSFCSDISSFEDWKEDEEQLEKIVARQIQ